MITFTSINELNKYLRNMLIEQSGLSSDRVLNSLSLNGTDLDKKISSADEEYNSIEIDNTTLLFELLTRASNNNSSEDALPIGTAQSKIIYNRAFRMHIILYGDSSPDLANTLVARIRSENVRVQMYNQGVFIETVDDPESINEYKNEMMWLRTDFNIDIDVEFNISQITADNNYEHLKNLDITNI